MLCCVSLVFIHAGKKLSDFPVSDCASITLSEDHRIPWCSFLLALPCAQVCSIFILLRCHSVVLSSLFLHSFPASLLPGCCQASGWSFVQEKCQNCASSSWLCQQPVFVSVIFFSSFWTDMVRSVSAEHRQLFAMSPYAGLHISAFSRFVSSPFKSRTVSTYILSRTSASREQRFVCWWMSLHLESFGTQTTSAYSAPLKQKNAGT